MSTPNKLSSLRLSEEYVSNVGVGINVPTDIYSCSQSQSELCPINQWVSTAENLEVNKESDFESTYLPSTVDVQAIRECHWISSTPVSVCRRRKYRRNETWGKDVDSDAEDKVRVKSRHHRKERCNEQTKSGSESSEMEESDTETETCSDSDSSFTSQESKSKSYEDSSSDESGSSSDASESHLSNSSSRAGSGSSTTNLHSTFSITNFDKGQLKLKIATLKSPASQKSVSDEACSSQTSDKSNLLETEKKEKYQFITTPTLTSHHDQVNDSHVCNSTKSSPVKAICGTKETKLPLNLEKYSKLNKTIPSNTYIEAEGVSKLNKDSNEEESLQEIGQDDLAAILRPESTNDSKETKSSSYRNTLFNQSPLKYNPEGLENIYSDRSVEENSEKEIELAEQLVSEAIKRIDIDMEREMFNSKSSSEVIVNSKHDIEDNLPSSTTDTNKLLYGGTGQNYRGTSLGQESRISNHDSKNHISVRKVSSTSCNAVSSTVEEPVNSTVEDVEHFDVCPSPDARVKFSSSPVTSSCQMSPCQVTSTVVSIKPSRDNDMDHVTDSNDSYSSFSKVQKNRGSQRQLKCKLSSKADFQSKMGPEIEKYSTRSSKARLKVRTGSNREKLKANRSIQKTSRTISTVDEVIEQVVKSCDFVNHKFTKLKKRSRSIEAMNNKNRSKKKKRLKIDLPSDRKQNTEVVSLERKSVDRHKSFKDQSINSKLKCELKRAFQSSSAKCDRAIKRIKREPHVPDIKDYSSSDESCENLSIFHSRKKPFFFESDFFLSRHRHKLKNWKVKTKNIVDPVFLADMEKLAKAFHASCIVSCPTFKAVQEAKNSLPSAFQYAKVNKKLKLFKASDSNLRSSDKDSGSEFEFQKERSCKRKSKKFTLDSHKLREKPESIEQRLPLKKRHRHMNTQSTKLCSETSTDSSESSKGARKIDSHDKCDVKYSSKFVSNKSHHLRSDSHLFGKSRHLSSRSLRIRSDREASSLKYKTSCEAFSKTKGLSFADLSHAYNAKQLEKKSDCLFKSGQPFYNSVISKVFNHDTIATIQHSVASMLSKCGALQGAGITPIKCKTIDIQSDVGKKCDSSSLVVRAESLPSLNIATPREEIGKSLLPLSSPGRMATRCHANNGISEVEKHFSRTERKGQSETDIKADAKKLCKRGSNTVDQLAESNTKNEKEEPKVSPNMKDVIKVLSSESLIKVANRIKKKHRRRRQNRTGFPTIRRKKRVKLRSIEDILEQNSANLKKKHVISTSKSDSEDIELKDLTAESDKLEYTDDDAKVEIIKTLDDIHLYEENTPVSKDDKLPRKKYITAGLFSNFFKQIDSRSRNSEAKTKGYEPYSGPLLPPPTYCSRWLRQRKIDFQLPYDLYWLHSHNLLLRTDKLPSWQYKKIRTNVYYDIKPILQEMQSCNCFQNEKEPDKHCTEECLNRMIYAECTPNCPSQEKCTNQKIQRHDWAPGLEKFMTKDKGYGIRTNLPIKTGEFILEYVGEVVSDREFKNRMRDRYAKDIHHYCLNLDKGLLIDGHRMGGEGRFVNHSCEPNCEMQKWLVSGLYRMALFAKRPIEAGEELGYDYNFSLFNPAEGQECKCGSPACRGVIGGKSQVVPKLSKSVAASVAPPVKETSNKVKKGKPGRKTRQVRPPPEKTLVSRQHPHPQMKPLSHQQRLFVQEHHCFLLRNLSKVKEVKVGAPVIKSSISEDKGDPVINRSATVFLTQLNSLNNPRSVRTRRVAQVEDDPEVNKIARLAQVLREIYLAVIQVKGGSQTLKKRPSLNKKECDSLDLVTLEKMILSGHYTTVQSFDQDFCKALTMNTGTNLNSAMMQGMGMEISRMKRAYSRAKQEFAGVLQDILGDDLPPTFLSSKQRLESNEEDVIRCICTLYHDEGLMIQCESCMVWQHWDCVGVEGQTPTDRYLCEICSRKRPCLDIKLRPQYPDNPPLYPGQDPLEVEGVTYYLTLRRDDGLQICQGECMYVLRDMPPEVMDEAIRQARKGYRQGTLDTNDFDIYRVEKLWVTKKGERFAFGHHYLRPHETFHEVSRKFFPNEVMRVPLYEVVPLKLLIGQCWVLDLNTFCKGRPSTAKEEHVYICELRVDRTAHLFAKIGKSKHSICQKSFAFHKFPERLKPSRTYAPHEVPDHLKSKVTTHQNVKNSKTADHMKSKASCPSALKLERSSERKRKRVDKPVPAIAVQPNKTTDFKQKEKEKERSHKRDKLNTILLKLLSQSSGKQCLDLSYLLDTGRRHRKKTQAKS